MTFEDLPLDKLKPQPHCLQWTELRRDDNARLLRSIEQYGILQPLLVEEHSFRIVDGHSRYMCARQLGLPTAPCLLRPDLDDGEYETLRFELQETTKPLTQKELADWRRRLKCEGIDLPYPDLEAT